MNYRNPTILALLFCIVLLSGCEKWKFNHKIKGTYKGVWNRYIENHGRPYSTDYTDNVNVEFVDEKNRSFRIESEYITSNPMVFEYDKKTEEYSYLYERHGYSYKVKAVFVPKTDSLTIYTDSRWINDPGTIETDTFRGKKQ